MFVKETRYVDICTVADGIPFVEPVETTPKKWVGRCAIERKVEGLSFVNLRVEVSEGGGGGGGGADVKRFTSDTPKKRESSESVTRHFEQGSCTDTPRSGQIEKK